MINRKDFDKQQQHNNNNNNNSSKQAVFSYHDYEEDLIPLLPCSDSIVYSNHNNYYKLQYCCVSVCPLQEVSGNDLTSRNKLQYLWLPTIRGQSQEISVHVNHCTSYRHEHQCLVQKLGNNGHLHTVAHRQLRSLIRKKILSQ